MVGAPWSKEEDDRLKSIVLADGPRNWTKVAMQLPGRIGKQCRERWHHHLDPDVVKKKWTVNEDILIFNLIKRFQTSWSEIARHVNGRSDNQIKNRYNSNLKRRIADGSLEELSKKYDEQGNLIEEEPIQRELSSEVVKEDLKPDIDEKVALITDDYDEKLTTTPIKAFEEVQLDESNATMNAEKS